MEQSSFRKRYGFSIAELVVAMAAASIVMLGAGVLWLDSAKNLDVTYRRLYHGVTMDGHVAIKAFDAAVRRATTKRAVVGDDVLQVFYYERPGSSTRLDRYARFHVTQNREFAVDYGRLDGSETALTPDDTTILAHDVEAVQFSVSGASIEMTLRFDSGREKLTLVSSAMRHSP